MTDTAKVKWARVVAEAIAAAVPLTRSTRLLEYRAEAGLVIQALGDRVGPVTLVDTSAGMRQVMHEQIAAGTSPTPACATSTLRSSLLPDDRFDVVVTSMVLHHVSRPRTAVGGVCRAARPAAATCASSTSSRRMARPTRMRTPVITASMVTGLAVGLRGAGFTEVTFRH